VGCQYSQLPGYCTKAPVTADLVGTWEPTQETIDNMKTDGGYSISTHQIILHANGTFSMLNMPDCVFSDQNGEWQTPNKKLRSGRGKWQITNFLHDGYKVWDVDFTLNVKPDLFPSGFGPVLIWQKNQYFLHFDFGDADMGHAVVFYKK
jgi:hypothetical protein